METLIEKRQGFVQIQDKDQKKRNLEKIISQMKERKIIAEKNLTYLQESLRSHKSDETGDDRFQEISNSDSLAIQINRSMMNIKSYDNIIKRNEKQLELLQ